MTYRLELRGITKQYPGVRANDAVSLRVRPGEIHAVLGENGAGKSTLMKIIYGAVKPDAGEMLFNGQAVRIRSPQEARALGISMVFQHFSLFDTLTAAENVWLGLDKGMPLGEVTRRIREVSGEYGLEVDPDRPVHTLTVGERQRVEIVRALMTRPQLLILDEPTSVLTPQAVDKLFVTLRQLAEQGCAIWLFGSPKDHAVAEEISQLAPGLCRNLCGATSLGQAVDLLALADLVVCNDSGLMHVAAALDRPIVALYGSSSPGFTPPLSDRAAIVSLNLECSPCFKRECPLGHLDCLNKLTPESVLTHCRQWIAP